MEINEQKTVTKKLNKFSLMGILCKYTESWEEVRLRFEQENLIFRSSTKIKRSSLLKPSFLMWSTKSNIGELQS